MPVDLKGFPTPIESKATPPAVVVWLPLFLLFTLGGALLVLLSWPKGTPTQGAWFWICVAIFPAGLWTVVFGIRVAAYLQAKADATVLNDVLAERKDEFIRRGQQPIFVRSWSHIGQWGASLGEFVRRGAPDAARDKPEPLVQPENAAGAARLQLALEKLLRPMLPDLQLVAAQGPLPVRLLVDWRQEGGAMLESAWHAVWQKLELPIHALPTRLQALDPQAGLLWLDEWLDEEVATGGRTLQLIIALRLGPEYAATHSECGAALLLNRSLQHERLPVPAARIHRPVSACPGALKQAVASALEWGYCGFAQVRRLWRSGDSECSGEMLIALNQLGVELASDAPDRGEIVLERTLGPFSPVSGWMLLALAVEQAAQASQPQLLSVGHSVGSIVGVVMPIETTKST